MIAFKINPKNKKHKRILKAIAARFKLSQRIMEKRHEQWRKAEEQHIAYMPERTVDATKRATRESGLPQYTTIVLPFTYAILLTAHTYWTTVFLSRNPIFQFSARHGETRLNVQAVESFIDYQMLVGEWLVPLYIWLLDTGKYGIGILGNYWEEEKIRVAEMREVETILGGILPTGRFSKKKVTTEIDGYHGNKWFNVRPYDFFPDTRVPLHKYQTGEFCAIRTEVGWNTVLKREAAGEYFNVDKLRKKKASVAGREEFGTSQLDRPGEELGMLSDIELQDVDFQHFVEMTIELSPKDWGLGKATLPEKWIFTCTKDFDLLVGARPLGNAHNKYPYTIQLYEVEGYSMNARGVPEVIVQMQNTMDWLVNTHFYNVRKALNDQFIVDPSRVVMKDVLDPLPGGIWRLKPAAYGTDPSLVAKQLQVVDVTQLHMKDTQFIWEMTQRMVGVTDNLMGLQQPGGRKTATEVRTASTAGINRLKTNAEYYSAMGWSLMSQISLQNSQQFYSLERQFKIAGDLMAVGGGDTQSRLITKDDIQGFYDYIPVDGTIPIDRFAQANLWTQLLAQLRNFPDIMAQYDMGGIFSWIAQLAGLKNVNQFKIEVQPDSLVAAQAQAGNLVPATGGGNGSTTRSTGTNPNNAEPRQVPSVGPTG